MFNPPVGPEKDQRDPAKAPIVGTRQLEQAEIALEQSRQKLAAKLQKELPPRFWKILESYGAGNTTPKEIVEVKLALLKVLGLDPSNLKGCMLYASAGTGSAIGPGKTIKMTLSADNEFTNLSFSVRIQCADGIVKINNKEVESSKLASAIRDARSELLRGSQSKMTFSSLVAMMQQSDKYPFIGQIKDSNQIIVLSGDAGFRSEMYKTFQCWIGDGTKGPKADLTSVRLDRPTRGPKGEFLVQGILEDGQKINIAVDSITGRLTVNGKVAVKSPYPCSAAVVASLQERGAQYEGLRTTIADCRARGVGITPTKTIAAGQSDPRGQDKLDIRASFADSAPISYLSNGLGEIFLHLAGAGIFSQPGLSRSVVIDGATGLPVKDPEPPLKNLNVPAFSLRSYPISATTGTVEIWDELRGGAKLFNFNLTDPKAKKQVAADIMKYVNTTFAATDYKKLINDIPSKRMSSFTHDAVVQPETSSSFSEILTKNPKAHVVIQYQPADLSDDYFDLGDIGEGSGEFLQRTLTISSASLPTLGKSGIRINGTMESATCDFPINPKGHTFTFNADDETLTIDGKKASQEYTDTFGNLITMTTKAYKDEKGKITSAVRTYSVLFPEGGQPKDGEGIVPVNIDLKGIGIVSGLSQLPYKKIGAVGSVSILSQHSQFSLSEPYAREASEKFVEGIHSAEALFGFAKGSHISNMIILNTDIYNAYSKDQSANATFITRSMLLWDQSIGNDLVSTGFHESIHALDAQSKGELSGGRFKKAFDAISNDDKRSIFFAEVNESAFRKEVTGGHSQDNTMELLASFMNSLVSEGWTDKMKVQTVSFRKSYKEVLEGLESNLQSLVKSGFLSKDAPVFKLVADRLAEVQRM